MAKKILTQEYLHSLFEYKNGELFWKINNWKKVKIGKMAGSINSCGYKQVSFEKEKYYVHRVIFTMFNGTSPKYIDHIDGNRLNNKIENLRECSQSENLRNQKIRSNTSSGFKNVSWNSRAKKWLVKLKIDGKDKRFGLFDNLEFADLVAQEARNKYYKKFARDF